MVRYADLPLLVIALGVFIAADLPALGFAVAAAAWIAQRAISAYAERRTKAALAAGDRRTAFRTTAVSTLGRVWLVSASVLLVGLLADREDGLAAAILAAALFTAQFGGAALSHLMSSDEDGKDTSR
ncbi:MAG TPA: hypothetical protein VIL04_13845 [Solirubrobacterales bacterium]